MALLAVLLVLFGISALVVRDGGALSLRTRRWVIGTSAVLVVLGTACRLVGFNRSLWIDEFGTLWVLESSIGETWSRVVGFHGQTPMYYLVVWPLIHAFGESEVLLRVPSLLFGIGATLLIYRTARDIGSHEAGLFAATLAWIAPVAMEASVNARPYAMALAFAALAFHGFARSVLTGDWRYRVLFVIGGAGLFLTQYVSSLVMLGIAAGYVGMVDLRGRYPWKAFVTDVALQCAAALMASPQIWTLWDRRKGLDWVGPPDYTVFISVLAPLLLPILIAGIYARHTDRVARSLEKTFLLAITAQVGVMTLLATWGTNLLVSRYLMVIAVPATVLAGLSLSRLRTPAAFVSVLFAVGLTAGLAALAWRSHALLTTVPNQDWRAAIRVLSSEVSTTPAAPVLYRPGFVEQDGPPPQSPAMLAPLRSPGQTRPELPIVPLTFSWSSPLRERYFTEVIVPTIDRAQAFFVVISGSTPASGPYAPLLLNWIETEFPNQFIRRPLGHFVGVDLLRFDRLPTASGQ